MLRAMALSILVLLGVAISPGLSRAGAERVNLINGIGLIDYSHKQDFKVGSWVKYRVTGSSELGMSDDYAVTILIAGEEKFWGEDCFWVETWTEPKVGPPNAIATLMSYAIFDDSIAVANLQLYSRKIITEIDPQSGKPVQVVSKRNAGSIKGRKGPKEVIALDIDTLGVEAVTVPRGAFQATKISLKQGIGSTADVGDSSMRTEVREDRMIFMSKDVPITGIVREDISNLIQRRTWRVGQSQGAPTTMNTMEHAKGSAELIEYGKGLTAQLVPPELRRSLEEYGQAVAKPATTKPRTTTTKRKTS